MLRHQIEFASAIGALYRPITGRASDPSAAEGEGHPEGLRACEEYTNVVEELQESLSPELDLIRSHIIGPTDQLLEIIKIMRKVFVKRHHKQLDYDRHRASLKKVQEKKDKGPKEEKALYKAEADVETATQEYNHYNDLLKEEMPYLFALEAKFIDPLFQSFYYMQLNVFYTLHERMQRLDIGYFDLSRDIEEAFEAKRANVQDVVEDLGIVNFRNRGRRQSSMSAQNSDLSHSPSVSGHNTGGSSKLFEARRSRAASASSQQAPSQPPPAYSSLPESSQYTAPPMDTKPRPSPSPKPPLLRSTSTEKATAMYDFEAQAQGDLSFAAGDVIEIIERTDNENEWWVGRIHGRMGQFPGMFLSLKFKP